MLLSDKRVDCSSLIVDRPSLIVDHPSLIVDHTSLIVDPSAQDNYAIGWANKNDHKKVVEYCQTKELEIHGKVEQVLFYVIVRMNMINTIN